MQYIAMHRRTNIDCGVGGIRAEFITHIVITTHPLGETGSGSVAGGGCRRSTQSSDYGVSIGKGVVVSDGNQPAAVITDHSRAGDGDNVATEKTVRR